MLADITHGTIWGDATLQYYLGGGTDIDFDPEFRTAYETYYDVGSNADAAFAYTDLMVRGFQMIDSVIATDFTRVTDRTVAQTTADIVLVTSTHNNAANPGLEGFCQFPGGPTRAANDYWSFSTFTSDHDYMNTAAELGGGSYVNWTLIHEVGHGLGIYHPFQAPANTSVGPAMDNERYTVMSYTGSSSGNAYGHAVTLMALDIAALQQQYGTETYATGNSTYTLFDAQGGALSVAEGAMSIGRAYATIWDTGGTDTIQYGNTANSVLINLNDATLDRSGVASDAAPSITAVQHTGMFGQLSADLQTEMINPDYHAGGFFSRVLANSNGNYSGIDGGFAIAYGVDIENATGGDQADMLIGNELANTLNGNAGNDVLVGGGGNDVLDGGEGCDTAGFSGARAEYTITDNQDGSVTVAHNAGGVDGTDTLTNIEWAQFSDQLYNMAADGALAFTPVTSSAFVGYGANVLYRNDDGYQSSIDLTSIFEEGIVVGGTTYTTISVNTNGNVTFGGGLSTYTPYRIEGSGLQIIAPYWADVDTRNPTVDGQTVENPGNVYWDFNTDRDSFIVTWDNVGYYHTHTDLLSSFQLELIDRGCGSVEIIFRYEDITWTAGDASGGEGGLGGTTARAGFSLGDTYFELPASGNQTGMLALESNPGNLGVTGVWQFIVAGGTVQGVGSEGDDSIDGTIGDDNILGGQGDDTIRGGDGNDTVLGGQGNDSIDGGDGDDVLTGQAWSDLIFGGAGNDFINGGFGHDRVNGGDGADRFFHLGIFDHGSDWVQDYDAAEGDVLVFGSPATIGQFQVNFAETASAGVAGVEEAFIIYRPTGQIMWALVDGAAQSSINLQLLNGITYDLLNPEMLL